MSLITDRILAELGDAKLIEKLSALTASDLDSLLLSVFHERSVKVTPVDILKWRIRPSDTTGRTIYRAC